MIVFNVTSARSLGTSADLAARDKTITVVTVASTLATTGLLDAQDAVRDLDVVSVVSRDAVGVGDDGKVNLLELVGLAVLGSAPAREMAGVVSDRGGGG